MSLRDEMAALGIVDVPFFVGEGFAKLFHMPAGRVIGQHAHKVDHGSMLLLGSVIVRTGSGESARAVRLEAPATLQMPAHVVHEIESVTPALWACIWPDTDGALTEDEFEKRVTE